jgi:hypothetical protein
MIVKSRDLERSQFQQSGSPFCFVVDRCKTESRHFYDDDHELCFFGAQGVTAIALADIGRR